MTDTDDKPQYSTGATPGGGQKKITADSKDAYKLKTAGGYKTAAEVAAGVAYGPARTLNAAGDKMYEWSAGQAELIDNASGTSIFDPVMCELVYRWWVPAGGTVLDPFSGGSVRGFVASMLGLHYTGIDLSGRQVRANQDQGLAICGDNQPTWVHGNSLDAEQLLPGQRFDFIFSCPPYADLEVYSNDPRDLSNMTYAQFLDAYRKIIAAACRMLKPDRFAAFVVGDVRDDKGIYRAFPWHTVQAFQDAGLGLYNEAVLVTAVGSLPVRTGKQFAAGRKLGKTHQNMFVFVKGDPKRASNACGDDVR